MRVRLRRFEFVEARPLFPSYDNPHRRSTSPSRIPGMLRAVRVTVAVILTAGVCQSASAADVWEPPATHAVIVGVLNWPGNALAPFSTKNRKDQELRDLL